MVEEGVEVGLVISPALKVEVKAVFKIEVVSAGEVVMAMEFVVNGEIVWGKGEAEGLLGL